MNSQFGVRIRELREKQNLYLRQVAPLLEMDTAQLSKIEKGLRQLKRDQIAILAGILKVEKDELLTLWVADQIIDVTNGEDVALKAMQVAEKEILSKIKRKEK
jgi:transcriptional regulator with XRE-family HTH domain